MATLLSLTTAINVKSTLANSESDYSMADKNVNQSSFYLCYLHISDHLLDNLLSSGKHNCCQYSCRWHWYDIHSD